MSSFDSVKCSAHKTFDCPEFAEQWKCGFPYSWFQNRLNIFRRNIGYGPMALVRFPLPLLVQLRYIYIYIYSLGFLIANIFISDFSPLVFSVQTANYKMKYNKSFVFIFSLLTLFICVFLLSFYLLYILSYSFHHQHCCFTESYSSFILMNYHHFFFNLIK